MRITDASEQQSQLYLQALISRDEMRHLEFKRVTGKMVHKALETLCAFANTDGGMLVLGVADLKQHQGLSRVFGVEENPEALDELQRKILSEIQPPISDIRVLRLPVELQNGSLKGQMGHIVLLSVTRSQQVHSIVDGGTYLRMDAGNRMMSAFEVTELSYQRGERSATAEPVDIAIERLQTASWQRYLLGRGALTGSFEDQLLRIGLAVSANGQVMPLRAAILLFADEPGSLLAASGGRADIRVMVYDGKQVIAGATPNFRKPPKTVRGPLIDQVDAAVRLVLDYLAEGVVLSGSGFKAVHAYPERVVKEAIVNAILHRDYRLNRDIFIRIFDDRIEVESPGVFPGNITPGNISKSGTKARNPLLALNLREFPVAPNLDAGEGVRMMFSEMASADLYPPQYRQNNGAAVESVTVTLFNAKRPSAWDEVSDWLDRHGFIANADVVRIAHVDTLKASKLLTSWREQGLLIPLPGKAKRNMAYAKPGATGTELSLLSALEDNN